MDNNTYWVQTIKWKCVSENSPAVSDGDNSGTVLSDFEEHRHGEIEMRTRRVAPPAIVVRQSEVRRAKVCRRHENGWISRKTPFAIVNTL